MYKSFRVKNFRCFKDLQINDLGRVNLIAGKNNTGKTALMEAMYIHSGNRQAQTFLREELNVYVRSPAFDLGTSSIVSLENIFHNFDTKARIELWTDETEAGNCPNGKRQLVMELVQPEDKRYDTIVRRLPHEHFRRQRIGDSERQEFVELLEVKNSGEKEPNYLSVANGQFHFSRLGSVALIPSAFFHARNKLPYDISAKNFSSLRQQNRIPELVETLKALEPRLADLALLFDGSSPRIYADIGFLKMISLTDLGEGINQFAGMILTLSTLPNSIVFIDEIENGIHHSVQKEVWKAIAQVARELDIQVFATTHSYEMIEAAHEAFKDDRPYDFRFHRLNRRSDTGEIEAVTYNKAGIEAFIRSRYEVRG